MDPEGAGRGLSYEQYLSGMLYMEGSTLKTKRTMDVMEMNVRLSDGGSHFRMDQCIDSMQLSVRAAAAGGYICTMETAVTYN